MNAQGRHTPPPGRANARPMTGSGGVSSTPRPLDSITAVSGILDRPPSRTMTAEDVASPNTSDTPPHSRDAFRPGFANRFAPVRGRRECRVLAAPAVSCANSANRCAHEHTGTAGAARHSLRDGFTAYTALSPETNSFCLRRRRIEGFGKSGWIYKTSAGLTPATGARTTRFAVRNSVVRRRAAFAHRLTARPAKTFLRARRFAATAPRTLRP
jgi:hypothetical protein